MQCGKLPNHTPFNSVVTKCALEYDGIATQLSSGLELQKIEVANQLLNVGRFYYILKQNQENRNTDVACLIDQKNEVISYRKQLARARTMSSINPVVLERLEASIEQSAETFEDMKRKLKKTFASTEVSGARS
jgi:hypothetical protein